MAFGLTGFEETLRNTGGANGLAPRTSDTSLVYSDLTCCNYLGAGFSRGCCNCCYITGGLKTGGARNIGGGFNLGLTYGA